MTSILSRNYTIFILVILLLSNLIWPGWALWQGLKTSSHLVLNWTTLQDPTLKSLVKQVGTTGILLIILSFACAGLFISYLLTHDMTVKKALVMLALFISFGSWGAWFYHDPHYTKTTVMDTLVFTVPSHIKIRLSFQEFFPQLRTYLQQAQAGKIHAYLRPYGFFAHQERFDIHIGEHPLSVHEWQTNHYRLSPKDIERLFMTKEMTVAVKTKGPCTILYRAVNCPLRTRKDQIWSNGQEIIVPGDGGIVVTFLFETRDGKPLAVFF
jgi:hypothetical protein